MVAWSIWYIWNEVCQGKLSQVNGAILHKARFLLDKFQIANFSVTPLVDLVCAQWEAPQSPWYKLNVDGAIFSSSQLVGVEAVIRDNEGRVTAALSKHLSLPLGSLEVEAKAMEEGVIFAQDGSIQEVIVECDSQIVANALNGESEPPIAISNILRGFAISFKSLDKQKLISHVKRQGNWSAHILAQYSKNIVSYVTWMEKSPGIIVSALA